MLKKSLVLYALLVNSVVANNTTILTIESGTERNTLVELYTSEGCSSCPPAEIYLNKLKNNSELWTKWIPVAFHVQYWDYIGWKDRYATKENGLRQSRYANLKRASTVYTPAFMVNGNSWRKGLFSSSLPNEKSSAGNLKIVVKNKFVKANYISKNKSPLKLNVAILGMDITSKIERGENEGRTAKHEFVVIGFDSSVSANSKWEVALPKLRYLNAKKYALAVWVSKINNPTPLQVVGADMPDYKP